MDAQTSSTNLRNRVNKLHLPKTRPLLPLFEIVSNSIHSIDEIKRKQPDLKGKILIEALRQGNLFTMESLPDVETYPIQSFKIKDNGIGLNSSNYASWQEFDNEYKTEIGGKGIGRLICLKAFEHLNIESIFYENDKYHLRAFQYKKTKEGFDAYSLKPTTATNTGTIVTLHKFDGEYQKAAPREIIEIARQLISHFQLYFIQHKEPAIIIRNQNNTEVNLSTLYKAEFVNEILKGEFNILDVEFKIFISKSFKAKSHKIHYCAHERAVKDEGLSKYLNDLKYAAKSSQSGEGYYFQVFIVSEYLNKNVNEERTGFNFSNDDDVEELEFREISLAKIRNNAITSIEILLKDFLTESRKEKLAEYLPIIKKDFPNYSAVINYNKDQVERLPVGLTKNELDIKLYEIESQWKLRVKESGIDIIEQKKDITKLDDYRKLYDRFLTEFNEIGQSDLARYVVHRRSVIDLLDKLWEISPEQKFTDEDIVHSLFFPIRETGHTVPHDKQNLWLIDERLTFNTLLASDKLFKQVEELESDSTDRIDLIIRKDEIYDNAALFAEKKQPLECFTIIEFKKPNRNDYVYGDPKKDPVMQVRKYIRKTIDKKTKVDGRIIEAKYNTPFYCYIIADITPSLHLILKEERFTPTPDGKGWFAFYDTEDYKAYIEVLPFQKVIADAKQRNRVLFERLNLST